MDSGRRSVPAQAESGHMHPTEIFRQVSREANLAFAKDRGFGVLSVGTDDGDGPLMSHVPFLLTEDCSAVHAHLTRANPILRSLEKGERPAVMAVSGRTAIFRRTGMRPTPAWCPHGTMSRCTCVAD